MINNVITAVSKVNVLYELTKDKTYRVRYERYDIETKAEEVLIICNMGFEKWYERNLFIIKEVTKY